MKLIWLMRNTPPPPLQNGLSMSARLLFTCYKFKLFFFFFCLGVEHYTFFHLRVSHSAAQKRCKYNGGNLVSFSSQEKYDTISYLITRFSCCPYWWTGLKYYKSTDTWLFIDGTVTKFALSILYGNKYFQQDKCVVICKNGTIYPIDCAEESDFICWTGHDSMGTPTFSG